jgi:putative transport protein
MVVGPEDAVDRVASKMGNSIRRLNAPNIATIFVGIIMGIVFGSLPFAIPGMPFP